MFVAFRLPCLAPAGGIVVAFRCLITAASERDGVCLMVVSDVVYRRLDAHAATSTLFLALTGLAFTLTP